MTDAGSGFEQMDVIIGTDRRFIRQYFGKPAFSLVMLDAFYKNDSWIMVLYNIVLKETEIVSLVKGFAVFDQGEAVYFREISLLSDREVETLKNGEKVSEIVRAVGEPPVYADESGHGIYISQKQSLLVLLSSEDEVKRVKEISFDDLRRNIETQYKKIRKGEKKMEFAKGFTETSEAAEAKAEGFETSDVNAMDEADNVLLLAFEVTEEKEDYEEPKGGNVSFGSSASTS